MIPRSQNIRVKISECLEAPHSFSVDKVEFRVAIIAPKEWILRYPGVVHGDPGGDGYLADHAISAGLVADTSDQGILGYILWILRSKQSDVYE